jgi:hypothetical protein
MLQRGESLAESFPETRDACRGLRRIGKMWKLFIIADPVWSGARAREA